MSQAQCVIAVIAEVLNKPQEEVTPNLRFVEDLGVTSFQIVDIVWRLEEVLQLKKEIPPSSYENVTTVGDVIEMVDGILANLDHSLERESDATSRRHRVFDVAFASDHAGVKLKAELAEGLRKSGYMVADLGPQLSTPVDYPQYADKVTEMVRTGKARFGVLICGTGIGMSMAANKKPGIRAALVSEPLSAKLTRQHNNANVLCLGARMIGGTLAQACLESFLNTEFEPGDDERHLRRILQFDNPSEE